MKTTYTNTPDVQESYARLSKHAAHIHSLVADVDVDQLEWYMDAIYLEYSKIRDEVSTSSWDLFHGQKSKRNWAIGNGVFGSSGSPQSSGAKRDSSGSTRSSGSAFRGSGDQDQWPLSKNIADPNITPEGDPVRCLRMDLERIIAGHRRWLVEIYKKYDKSFTPEVLESVTFLENEDKFQLVKAPERSERSSSLHHRDIWERRFNQYNKLKRDAAELSSLTSSTRQCTPTRLRRVVVETIAPYGDAILEFANTGDGDDEEAPILRFRVSSHMLTECSPIFARMFSKHPNVLDAIPPLDLEHDLPQRPIQRSAPDGSTIQLWRMPQVETNKESALTILLHAAHMHNEHVPRAISFEQLVALSEAAIRYRCAKPLELFFEHCWLHQWIHKASDDMPDGLVTISYAFGRRRLFSRVTKSVILHLMDEEGLRAKTWPQVVKDKIWAVRSAKMAQVYATCSETIEEYLRRPRASSAIPLSPNIMAERSGSSPKLDSPWSWRANSQSQQASPVPPSPVEADQQPKPKSPPTPKSKKDSWSWRPLSSSKLPPVGSPQRPISRPVILPPPPPPPPAAVSHRQTRSIDSTSSDNSANTRAALGTFPTELFAFTSTPRCPKGSHWCDATNLGWLLLVYNELRLFSAILGPSALTGLSLSPNQADPAAQPRSLAKVLDALRGMANPPHPVHSGSPCDPVPAFRDAVNDIYNSVTGLALQEVDGLGLRHRLGLSLPRLHLEGEYRLSALGVGQTPTSSREEIVVFDAEHGGNNNTNKLKEEIFIGAEEFSPPPFEQRPRTTPTSTAPSRAFTEESICLSILRHLETSDDLRAVAVLNHRTYNIYKTHETDLTRGVVLGGRNQTMLQLTGNQQEYPSLQKDKRHRTAESDEEADESYYYFRKSKYQSHDAIDEERQNHQQQQNDPFSSHILLSPDLLRRISNVADDPEGASTRAIKRASSEASSSASCSSACSVVDGDDASDSETESDWNFASGELSQTQTISTMLGEDGHAGGRNRAKSFCPSLDITEGLNTASILQAGIADTTTLRPSSPSTLKPKKGTPRLIRSSFMHSSGEKDKAKEQETKHRRSESSWLAAEADIDTIDPGNESETEQLEYLLQSGIRKEKDSDFYSINEQEAYRILWPDEASIKSGTGPGPGSGSCSMPRGTSQAFGSSTSIIHIAPPSEEGNGDTGGGNYTYGGGGHDQQHTAGGGGREYKEEPPQIKYSREDGSWLALKGAQFRALVGARTSAVGGGSIGSSGKRNSLEAKSLTLMAAGNGNNKLLREEFDQQQRRRTTTHQQQLQLQLQQQQVEIGLGMDMGMGAVI